MATVYLARDVRHKRPVALKTLHPHLAASLGPERFEREIEFAARLQHPHILTVLDSGEAAGQLWFTMPFVQGESLRERLRRDRQLSVDDALRIGREVALALDYAHQEGVIHRDIKPENILLTKDGSTLVADFGIARALTADEHLTQTGLSVGTPTYMSPEQASGEKLDARTDIYSLGVVLYELLAGAPPFTGTNAQAIILKRLAASVPSVRAERPNVPESVDRAIQRALAVVPADRFATAQEFGRALQGPPMGLSDAPTLATASSETIRSATTPAMTTPAATTPAVTTPAETTPAVTTPVHAPARGRRVPLAAIALGLGFLIGVGVLFAWRRTRASTTDATGPRVLAVLPFENLGDSTDDYFADGVTEEVRGKLAKVPGLEVIARKSSDEFRHSTKRPQEIARELGADYLLTATVRWEKHAGGASRVRVTPELVDVGPGHAPRTRWQDGFDASLTDVFQVQADIAGKVASALDVALGDSTRRDLAAKPTANLAAYDAFLKGEAVSEDIAATDPPSLRQAVQYYQQAVALDSGFVEAWAQLARASAFLYANSKPTPELAAQSLHAAQRAESLAPNRPEGQLALSTYYLAKGDNERSYEAAKAGLKIAPNNVDVLGAAAIVEPRVGQWEAALQHFTKAAALDPRSIITARRTGVLLVLLRRYPEATVAVNRALALAPTNLAGIHDAAALALSQGDLPGAQAVVKSALARVDSAALIAYFANFQDLYWVLDDAQQRLLLRLPPSAFDNDRATWSVVLAQTYWLRGDTARGRAYADSARVATEEEIRVTPNDPQRRVFHGLELAYLGRKKEAIAEGEYAVSLVPMSRDMYAGSYIRHQLARIYLLVGEPEKALDLVEPLLKAPYYLSPGWLRIDPNFTPLKGNPRFERLAGRQ